MAAKSIYLSLIDSTMDRELLAALWHKRATITRNQIFGNFDAKLKPSASVSQSDVCVPGMVGGAYEKGGIAIVSVNPAGGKDDFRPTPADDRLYEAAIRLRAVADLKAFEELNDAFVVGMPSWGPQWRVIDSILRATGKDLVQISYPYLVPFRSREILVARCRNRFWSEATQVASARSCECSRLPMLLRLISRRNGPVYGSKSILV